MKAFSIASSTEVLEDRTKKLTIDDVLTSKIQSQFQVNMEEVILKKNFNSAYWIKIPLQNVSSNLLWLEIPSENIWYIDLYDIIDEKYELTYSTGALRSISTKIYDSYLLPIQKFNNSKIVYLRLETQSVLITPIYAGTVETLIVRKKFDDYALGIFWGFQLGLLVYSLLLLGFSYNSFFIFIYIIVSFVAIPFINHQVGLLKYLGDEFIWFLHKNFFILLGLLLFFANSYSVYFLKLKGRRSFLYYVLNTLGATLGILLPFLALVIPTLSSFLVHYYEWLFVLVLAFIFGTSWYIQRSFRDKSLRFFTLGWLVFLIFDMTCILVNYGWLSYDFILNKVLYIGVGLSNLFIVLALSERIFLKQKKIYSKKRTLDQILYQKKLKQSKDNFEELIQLIPVGIYRYSKTKDGDLKFTYVSPKWCELNGLNREEVLQDPSIANKIFHPEDLPSFIEANAAAIANRERFLWEGRIIVNNTIKFVHIESFPIVQPDGSIDWIGIQYDISQNRLQEQDLQLFAKLAENTSDSVVITNAEGLTIWVNKAFFEMTGYTLQEVVGRKPGDVLQGTNTNPATKARLHNAIQNFQPIREILLNYRKDQKPYWVDLTINPIFDETGKCCNFIGIQRNVTEQIEENLNLKKESEHFEEEKKKILRYVQEKSEFLAAMSHEIRTPLTAIVGFTELLSDAIKEESQKYFLNNIQIAARNLMEIVNNILDYSKIEAGKMKLHFFQVDLNEIFEQCFTIISNQAKRKGLNLIKNIDPKIPPNLLFDGIKVQQVLINLLSNAVKFTLQGEIELGVKVETHEPELGLLDLTFYIRDTGIGISEDRQEAIFEAFNQENPNIQKDFGGTGLGLAICNKLLNLMGSKLELKSQKGKGSLFYFTIIAKSHISDYSFLYDTNYDRLKVEKKILETLTIKVLIVDDIDVNRFLFMSIIKNLLPNASILEASSGQEAIEIFKQESPELILLDLQMPVLNGYETAKKIRELQNSKQTVIFSISAGNINQEEELSYSVGINKYLTKPISKAELRESILYFFKNE